MHCLIFFREPIVPGRKPEFSLVPQILQVLLSFSVPALPTSHSHSFPWQTAHFKVSFTVELFRVVSSEHALDGMIDCLKFSSTKQPSL